MCMLCCIPFSFFFAGPFCLKWSWTTYTGVNTLSDFFHGLTLHQTWQIVWMSFQQRIWNRYTEKVPIGLFQSKGDRDIPRYLLSLKTRFDFLNQVNRARGSNFRAAQNLVSEHFNKRFQLPIHCLYKRFQILGTFDVECPLFYNAWVLLFNQKKGKRYFALETDIRWCISPIFPVC